MASSPKRSPISGAGTPKQGEVKLELPASPISARKLSKPNIYEKSLHSKPSFWDREPVWM